MDLIAAPTGVMLATAQPETDVVGDRVMTIHAPYALDKAMLLNAIVEILGGRAILRHGGPRGGRVMHVFGMQSDLERIDLLFTSLLVQIGRFIARARPWLGENLKVFKRDWLAGFTRTVRARLAEVERRTRNEVQEERDAANVSGPSVALVLADRRDQVSRAYAAAHPNARAAVRRRLAGHGYHQGVDAGNRADLGGTRPRTPLRDLRAPDSAFRLHTRHVHRGAWEDADRKDCCTHWAHPPTVSFNRFTTEPGSTKMLWHATFEPQRSPLCGSAGLPNVGRPSDLTASEKPNQGRRRT
ncbi:hypothetical protein K1W54_02910 [Micromonospora sp. CPCC 205371]|nr:hypothetical protein [Micromonospora sp. CPCC 205371]